MIVRDFPVRLTHYIGFILTYIAPLAFVLCVTMGKEAFDDYQRYLRDNEANSQKYTKINSSTGLSKPVPSSSLRVGDLVCLEKNQRVPADMVLLRTSDVTGTCFIRTDQLDGETDWKLRVAVPATQKLASDAALAGLDAEVYGRFFFANFVSITDEHAADAPTKDIHSFIGTFTGNLHDTDTAIPKVEPLTAENVLWSNTVLAAGTIVGFVIYTGSETRAVMNTSHPETKVGLLDLEINRLAKVCDYTFSNLRSTKT